MAAASIAVRQSGAAARRAAVTPRSVAPPLVNTGAMLLPPGNTMRRIMGAAAPAATLAAAHGRPLRSGAATAGSRGGRRDPAATALGVPPGTARFPLAVQLLALVRATCSQPLRQLLVALQLVAAASRGCRLCSEITHSMAAAARTTEMAVAQFTTLQPGVTHYR